MKLDMKCSILGCDSYKYIATQKIAYFKYPFHDAQLVKQWLTKMKKPNWKPTEAEFICSLHFRIDDVDFSNKLPQLKPNAVPMIFPIQHFQNISKSENKLVSEQDNTQLEPDQAKIENGGSTTAPKIFRRKRKITPKPSENENGQANPTIVSSDDDPKKLKPTSISPELDERQNLRKHKKLDTPLMNNLSGSIKSPFSGTEVPTKEVILPTKKAVFKIQIDKIVHQDSTNLEINDNVPKNYIEEIELENNVVFRFNPLLGEIQLTKSTINQQNNDELLPMSPSVGTDIVEHESSSIVTSDNFNKSTKGVNDSVNQSPFQNSSDPILVNSSDQVHPLPLEKSIEKDVFSVKKPEGSNKFQKLNSTKSLNITRKEKNQIQSTPDFGNTLGKRDAPSSRTNHDSYLYLVTKNDEGVNFIKTMKLSGKIHMDPVQTKIPEIVPVKITSPVK